MTTIAATGVLRASWLLLAFPIFGAVVLLVGGRRTDKWGHLLGVAMPVASFVYAVIAFFALLGDRDRSQDLHLFSYIPVGGFQVSMGILVDPLSASFMLLITGVGSLIIIYSVGYMAHDSDRRRFFGYLNLFIAAMLLLVLADNYLGLYIGWEGVGLASYLLIGFWQFKNSAAVAAKKAFVVNRVGDAGLTLAIFLMFAEFGTVSGVGVQQTSWQFGEVGGKAGAIADFARRRDKARQDEAAAIVAHVKPVVDRRRTGRLRRNDDEFAHETIAHHQNMRRSRTCPALPATLDDGGRIMIRRPIEVEQIEQIAVGSLGEIVLAPVELEAPDGRAARARLESPAYVAQGQCGAKQVPMRPAARKKVDRVVHPLGVH